MVSFDNDDDDDNNIIAIIINVGTRASGEKRGFNGISL
jgi:hypothetical protein